MGPATEIEAAWTTVIKVARLSHSARADCTARPATVIMAAWWPQRARAASAEKSATVIEAAWATRLLQ